MSRHPLEERVLALTPTAQDAEMTRTILSGAGFPCATFANLRSLCEEAKTSGIGAALITEEVMVTPDLSCLIELLHAQPTWSDLPLVVLTHGGTESPGAELALKLLGNVTLLERPVRVTTLISAIRSALAARRRQYEIRTHLQERERRETDLRESREQLRLMVESVRDYALFTVDQDGCVTTWNIGATRVFGYETHEILGQDTAILFTPDDRAAGAHTEEMRTARETGHAADERWHLRKDGTRFYASGMLTPLRDSEGLLQGYTKIARDVTDKKRAEDARREAMEQYERQVRLFEGIATNTPDFVYIFDVHGRFQYANRRLLDVWGMELPEIIGKTCRELGYEQWHHDMHMREIAQVIETRQPIIGEVPFKAPLTGIFGVYEYIFAPVIAPNGEVELVAGTTRDITERKRAADVLREEAQRKDEFLATLAHELRNPLAPIVTATEIMRLRPDDLRTVEKTSETIRRQVDHMRHLLDDLLDVARITRGMIELRMEPVDLGNVVSQAVQMARPLVDGKRQELVVAIRGEVTPIEGDSYRLTQVVANLLTNASKFTPECGQIMVTLVREDGEAVIRVQDTGKGIPADKLPHVFDLFTQVNPSIDRAEGGLGLGLTLVRRLVEKHGGRVEARSEGPGHGSQFEVRLPGTLPAAAAEETSPSALNGSRERRLRVLAVDDNRDAADTLTDLLSLWGHEASVAYSGTEALAVARRSPPDVVLLDIGLPETDGYTVARQFRADPTLTSARLVALTGFGQVEDRRRAHEAGFDEHVTKPLDPDALRSLLARI